MRKSEKITNASEFYSQEQIDSLAKAYEKSKKRVAQGHYFTRSEMMARVKAQ